MGTCLSDDEVLDATQGRLDPQSLQRIEDHVGECPDCRVVLAETARALEGAFPPAPAPVTVGAVTLTHGVSAAARAAAAPFAPGAKISRYTIVRPIGMGGAGIVYEAFDPQLERRVALKMVHASARSGGATAERLLREAQAMARLSHPNVVGVHDAGTHAGEVFLAMEFVDGMTLSRWLRDARPGHEEILRVFTEAGRGLAAAHAANLIHRDFKPENVLIGSDGRVRVTDFGLARSMDVSEPERAELVVQPLDASSLRLRSSLLTLTQADALVGTPAYMAPEQFLGARADARTDQFSFCVALYGALYGQRPFGPLDEERITLLALARDVTSGALRRPPLGNVVPVPYWAVLKRGLESTPEARYGSLDELLAALAAAGQVEAPPVPRRRVRPLLAASTIVLAGAAVAAAYLLPSPTRDEGGTPSADRPGPSAIAPGTRPDYAPGPRSGSAGAARPARDAPGAERLRALAGGPGSRARPRAPEAGRAVSDAERSDNLDARVAATPGRPRPGKSRAKDVLAGGRGGPARATLARANSRPARRASTAAAPTPTPKARLEAAAQAGSERRYGNGLKDPFEGGGR